MRSFLLVVAVLLLATVACAQPYAVIVSEATLATPGWGEVVQAALDKHSGTLVTYQGEAFPRSVKRELSRLRPEYCCFVGQLVELGEEYVRRAHQLTRALDADPWGDAVWAILTGARPEDALRQLEAPPLRVESGLLKTCGGWLNQLTSGEYHSEANLTEHWLKQAGGVLQQPNDGPEDDTPALVDALNQGRADFVVTSGHAWPDGWQLHYPTADPEGYFLADNGTLYGLDNAKRRLDILSTNPKIIYAVGNCLAGRLTQPNCLAAGWLGSGGAVQFAGYTVETWFGYMGWGVASYFLDLQDQYTFAEASFLINQALLFEERHPLPDSNQEGLAYDRDVWALYGDPAYEARLPRVTEPLYEQSIERLPAEKPGQVRLRLMVKLNRAARLGKPVIWRLPVRLLEARLVSGPGEVEVADDLVLARFSQPGEPELPAGTRIKLVIEGLEASDLPPAL